MNDHNFNTSFPDVEEGAVDPKKSSKANFSNELYSSDGLWQGEGFINEIKQRGEGDSALYFVRLGLLCGLAPTDSGERQTQIQNVDLLVGSTLKKWARAFAGQQNFFKGIRVRFEIRNLMYSAELHDGKPVLRNRGILETIQLGYLSK